MLRFTVALLAMLLTGGPTAAQRATLVPVPQAEKLVVPAAQLMRVDEGVFEIPIDSTIDLTNRKILLAISTTTRRNEKQCCNITLNGERMLWNGVGHRFDLKELRATREFVQDRGQCFLDVVDIATPKGARWLATFRLHCP